jgi:thiamine biosynthesis lipoprotein
MEINLGGIGKGYALDRCAEQLTESRVHNFLLHGGQSSILARGNRTGIDKQGRAGWKIGLRHPIWHEKYLADIFLHNRALGTSGTGRQGFFHQGKRYGHIIDPRTGFPAEGVLSSTVLAPTAAEADALATAFYVLGPESSLQICQQRTDIAAIIVVPGEKQGTIELHTANLDDSEWQLYE